VVKEDRFWVKMVKDGRKNDFAHIIKKYKDPIYYYILKMVRNEDDAMDLAQETFIKAYNGLSGYQETYSFKSWLFTIASHHTIDFLRKRKRRKEIDLQEVDRGKPYVPMVDSLIRDETMQRLDREIERLPDNYRMVILLKHKEELTIEEIGTIMDIPEGTVKVWLHRARAQLRKRIERDETAQSA
jgi:RNA polymerase sigma factor (sigma-70 family)